MNERLSLKLETLPDSPGCYLMKQRGNIIYVGKAINLKNRVRSYFQKGEHSPKVSAMMPKVDDFDIVICSSDMEALLLECNLIKEHRPYYNILLKDDKHYPYLRINPSELFPRLNIVRKVAKDGAMYFGPYLSAGAVRQVFQLLRSIFPLRTCRHKLPLKKPIRPCLNYEIGRCLAPCAGKCTEAQYGEIVQGVIEFLQGKHKHIKEKLSRDMQTASSNMQYEKAAEIRDALSEIDRLTEKQNVLSAKNANQDIISLYQDDLDAMAQVLFIRQGKMIGGDSFLLEREGREAIAEVLRSFVLQFYQKHKPAREVIVKDIVDSESITLWLKNRRGTAVNLTLPKRGDKLRLVKMAERNAKDALIKHSLKAQVKYERSVGASEELASAIGLKKTPVRIEGFDISNTQGGQSVASMVVFINGEPERKEYRRFNIKTVEGADDLASMAEAISRRVRRSKDSSSPWQEPDLIMVDGGTEQLKYAIRAMHEAGGDYPIFALSEKQEEIWLPGRKTPIMLPDRSPALYLVQRIRDEAHRFAISAHRKARAKKSFKSSLEEIPGIGPARRRALLAKFRNMEAIKNASMEELLSVKGMNEPAARALYDAFHG